MALGLAAAPSVGVEIVSDAQTRWVPESKAVPSLEATPISKPRQYLQHPYPRDQSGTGAGTPEAVLLEPMATGDAGVSNLEPCWSRAVAEMKPAVESARE